MFFFFQNKLLNQNKFLVTVRAQLGRTVAKMSDMLHHNYKSYKTKLYTSYMAKFAIIQIDIFSKEIIESK